MQPFETNISGKWMFQGIIWMMACDSMRAQKALLKYLYNGTFSKVSQVVNSSFTFQHHQKARIILK